MNASATVALVAVAATGCAPGTASPEADSSPAAVPAAVPRAERTVILVMDGVREAETFGLEPTNASALPGRELFATFVDPMLPEGTLVHGVVGAGATLTLPAHADFLTGRQNFIGMMPAPAGPGEYRPELPTLFEAIAASNPERTSKIVTNANMLESATVSLYPGNTGLAATYVGTITSADPSDVGVVAQVRAELSVEAPPAVVLANLHMLDMKGHSATNPEHYARAVQMMGADIAGLWQWIESEESGLAGTTLFVLASDHGRHAWGNETEARGGGLVPWDYVSHGDQCAGCRDILLFIAGPGVRRGAEIDTPTTLRDLGATLAAALGVSLPHGSGRVVGEVYESPPGQVQSGPAWIAGHEGGVVTAEWTGEVESRTVVRVDDTTLGSPTFLAEDPEALSTSAGLLACWREFPLSTSELDWNWTPTCEVLADGTPRALEFPVDVVGPHWRPALLEDADGSVVFAWSDNPNFFAENGGFVQVRVGRFVSGLGGEYTQLSEQAAIFPGNPSVALAGGELLVAWAASDAGTDENGLPSENPNRYTRHVEVARVPRGGGGAWTSLWRSYTATCDAAAMCDDTVPTTDDHGEAWARVERPALWASDAAAHLAWVSWNPGEVTVHATRSQDTLDTWATPTRVDDTGRVLGHVEPLWHDGELYYPRLAGDGTVELCRWSPGGTAACVATGAEAIVDLSFAGNELVALLARDGTWAVEATAF